jgi:hypothetical protein
VAVGLYEGGLKAGDFPPFLPAHGAMDCAGGSAEAGGD